MYAMPDDEEIIAIAGRLGVHLSPEEAAIYRRHLVRHLADLDRFVQTRLDEPGPPLLSPARERGHRPAPEEDLLNAWRWKCRIEGSGEGVLAGKAVSFKDHIAVAGIPMSLGSFALDDFVPDFDATVVTRALAAGATVTGKNVMNGLSGGGGTGGAFGDYGRPLNPHNRGHITGGSSSGSAAAVVAGEVDISFGGDQGGSVRMPAALCGAVGLKPTFGLISHFGIGFGTDPSLDYVGPIARTVQDAAAALQATAGYDPLDPRQRREIPDGLDVMSSLGDGVAGLRLGLLDEGFDGAEDDVKDLVLTAVELLAKSGARVSKVSVQEHHWLRTARNALRDEGALALFNVGFFGAFSATYYPPSVISAVGRLWAHDADMLSPRNKMSLLLGELSRRNYHGRVYAKAQNARPVSTAAYDAALAEVDMLVMPTVIRRAPAYQPPPADYLEALDHDLRAGGKLNRNTVAFNYTGHPALAVPVGKADGLPVSMQLVGRHLDDALLLRAAYAFQQSADWDAIIRVDS